MLIYKIFTAAEWAELQANGTTRGAHIDLVDGYIHFSTGAQVAETAAKHFAGQNGLCLIACASTDLAPELKWEVSRGGDKFPHLYRALHLSDVLWDCPLPLKDGVHQFPDGVI